MRLPLPLHSYSISTASTARLVNCYAEQLPQDAKAPMLLRTAPGITAFATPGSGPGRGIAVMGNTLYAISGTNVYSVSSGGVATLVGAIAGTSPCYLAANTFQLAIVAGGTSYVVSAGTVTPITDVDFTARSAGPVVFDDNYLLFVDQGSGRFFGSDLANALSYDALNFATAEGAPDNMISIGNDHRQAVLFCQNHTELWYNAGGTGFPFVRSPGGFIELGIAGPTAHCKLDNSMFWLANDRTVRRLSGQTPLRVSQHGMERALLTYSRVDDCQAFSYTLGGHLCAIFRFPTAQATWVFDATVNEWHERASYLGTLFKGLGIASCYNKNFIQHPDTGAVGIIDPTVMKEWGDPIRPEWTYQPVYQGGKRLFHSLLEMACETGVGLVAGQGIDPRITLEYSNDGGKTWRTSTTETIGAMGKYKTLVNWLRLGMARDRVYRASMADPVPLTVWGTNLDVTAGAS